MDEIGKLSDSKSGGKCEISSCPPGVLSVLTLEHKTSSSGRSEVVLRESQDMCKYLEDSQVQEQMCKKDRESCLQRKISCWPCTIVMESIQVPARESLGDRSQGSLERVEPGIF